MSQMKILFWLSVLGFSTLAQARSIPGYLTPKEPGDGPATTVWAETYDRNTRSAGPALTELLDFILPSPNQEDAGSCLYMSHTGNVEWWLNKLKNNRKPVSDGPTDLSERYSMYLSLSPIAYQIPNPLTDSVYLFNLNQKKAVLNRSHRFTKGWWKYTNGSYQKAKPNEPGAEYSTTYNWISEKPSSQADAVRLPKFQREVLFKDPNDNRWGMNTMPKNIVEKIKSKLRERKAPVLVVYNHYLIWHVVMIVGYDDSASTEGCQFTNGFVDYTRQLADEAKLAGDQNKAEFYLDQGKAIARAQEKEGGCQEKGVFLVRDSIYSWPDGPLYDYDPKNSGEELTYAAPVVKKEYQWLKRFGNHAIQIYVAD